MNNSLKKPTTIIIIILALLAIAAAAFAIFYKPSKSGEMALPADATPVATQDPVTETVSGSTELKTYNNFGISIQYPSDWKTPSENFGRNVSISFDDKLSVYTQPHVDESGIPVTTDETFDQMVARMQATNDRIYSVKDISANGIKGKEITYKDKNGTPSTSSVVFPFRDNLILQAYPGETLPHDKFIAIISTLKYDNATLPKTSATTKMKIYQNNGVRFEYPELTTEYAHLGISFSVDMVDKSKLDTNGCYTDLNAGDGPGTPMVTTINGIKFCSVTGGGAAAGSQYNTYDYMTIKDEKTYVLHYQVRSPNCGVFGNDVNNLSAENKQYRDCVAEKNKFTPLVNDPIKQSISTFTFTK